jgi:hypothetical protein
MHDVMGTGRDLEKATDPQFYHTGKNDEFDEEE